jgi:hypothetical protein
MNNDFKPKRGEFTFLRIAIATVATVVVATFLGAGALSELAKHQGCRAQPITCVNNLKQLGIAFRGFGIDLGGFPMSVSADTNSPGAAAVGPLNTISAR